MNLGTPNSLALENATEKQKEAEEDPDLGRLVNGWKQAFLDLPCLKYILYTLSLDPYEQGDLDAPLEYEHMILPRSTSIRLISML